METIENIENETSMITNTTQDMETIEEDIDSPIRSPTTTTTTTNTANNRLNESDDLNNSTFVNNLLTSLKTRSQSDPKQLQQLINNGNPQSPILQSQPSFSSNTQTTATQSSINTPNSSQQQQKQHTRNMQFDLSNDNHPDYFYSHLNSITNNNNNNNNLINNNNNNTNSINNNNNNNNSNNNNNNNNTNSLNNINSSINNNIEPIENNNYHSGRKRSNSNINNNNNIENDNDLDDKGKDEKSKGLRYLSYKVCQKVQSKKTTSYVEVSNELLSEYVEENRRNMGPGGNDANFKTNTVKRRIYDVLNVFQAMNIITKDKQKISWVGLPTGLPSQQLQQLKNGNNNNNNNNNNNTNNNSNTQEDNTATTTTTTTTATTEPPQPQPTLPPPQTSQSIAKQLEDIKERIQSKKRQLKELNQQEKDYSSLYTRNCSMEQRKDPSLKNKIFLPFIVLSTQNSTVIDCEVENERSKYFFNFSQAFNIIDDNSLVKSVLENYQLQQNINNTNNNNNNYNTTTTTTTAPNRSNSMPSVIPSQHHQIATNDKSSPREHGRKKRKKEE